MSFFVLLLVTELKHLYLCVISGAVADEIDFESLTSEMKKSLLETFSERAADNPVGKLILV